MKKLTCTLLVLAMLLSAVCLFSACGDEQTEQSSQAEQSSKEEQSEQAEESKYEPPEGYQPYDNGEISFVYPADWSATDGSTVTLIGTENTNNITVVFETKTDLYETWDLEAFETTMKPVYESMSATISDISLEQKKKGDLNVTVINYNLSMQGIDMKQTLYIVSTASKTYTVTVTTVVEDAELISNVYDSLTVLG